MIERSVGTFNHTISVTVSVDQTTQYNLSHSVTSAFSIEQNEWMSSDSDSPLGRKRPHTRSVMKALEKESAVELQPETSRRWSTLPDLTNNQSSDENQPEEVSFYDIWGEDDMPYQYS